MSHVFPLHIRNFFEFTKHRLASFQTLQTYAYGACLDRKHFLRSTSTSKISPGASQIIVFGGIDSAKNVVVHTGEVAVPSVWDVVSFYSFKFDLSVLIIRLRF